MDTQPAGSSRKESQMRGQVKPSDGPAATPPSGSADPTKTDELQMRTFWRRWRQLVSDDPSLELAGP